MRISTTPRPLSGAIVIFVFLQVLGSSATIYQVDSDIQAAIDAADPGDTLRVAPGNYEKIVIDKGLTLVGDGSVISASERKACIDVYADEVNISGFTVRDGLYGIKLNYAQGCTISNNTVIHCVQPGITLLFSDDNVIKDNVANFNGLGAEGWYGIYLSNSNDNLIEGNIASDNGEYGLCMWPFCCRNVIQNNVMERNDYGVYMFTDCSDNVIQSNRLAQNRISGLRMIHDCTNNQVLNNIISDNDVVGILLQKGSGRNLVLGNEISNNKHFGVQIQEGAGGNTVVENNVSGSKKGFFVSNDGNLIYNNRIFDNVIPADDLGANQWHSAYPQGGNFWGDYQGQDLMNGTGQNVSGSDGFGDLPYRIGYNIWDRYPIMGTSIMPLKLTEGRILPLRAQVGGQVKVQATFDSKYGVTQVCARAHSILNLAERPKYIPMDKVEDNIYEGVLRTAILDPGRYDIVLTAKDVKGNEIEESIGELDLLVRSGRNINSIL